MLVVILSLVLLQAEPVESFLVTSTEPCAIQLPRRGGVTYQSSAAVSMGNEQLILLPGATPQTVHLLILDADTGTERWQRYELPKAGRRVQVLRRAPPACKLTPGPVVDAVAAPLNRGACRFRWGQEESSAQPFLEMEPGVGCQVYVPGIQRIAL